jgi:hypothetical protein
MKVKRTNERIHNRGSLGQNRDLSDSHLLFYSRHLENLLVHLSFSAREEAEETATSIIHATSETSNALI